MNFTLQNLRILSVSCRSSDRRVQPDVFTQPLLRALRPLLRSTNDIHQPKRHQCQNHPVPRLRLHHQYDHAISSTSIPSC